MPVDRESALEKRLSKVITYPLRVIQNRQERDNFNPNEIAIGHEQLYLPRLQAEFDGYRLVHISDIHYGTWINKSRLAGLIEIVNEASPDLVAITGDFVTFDPDRFYQELITLLSELRPKDAVIAVLGNHDHWTDPGLVREILNRSQIVDVSNAVFTLERGNARLHLAGVDDYLEGLDRLDLVLQHLPEDGAAILLAHEPDFADISAATGRFDLQLSGHTHGGQVVFPFLGPLILPPRGRKYPLGFYRINGMVQYTNRGLGTTTLQFRMNCPPEVAVFTLRYRN